MSLDRHHLQLLIAIADHGQLAAAARSLHLSPSAASRRISEAERRLDAKLIRIVGREADLTPAGRMLAATARLTEQQLTRAEQASRWLHHGRGVERLRIGVGPFDQLEWHRRLFDAVEALGVHSVDLVSVAGGREDQAIRAGEIDLAAVVMSTDWSGGSNRIHLADDRLVAVAPPGFTGRFPGVFHPADVAGHDYLAFSFEPLEGWELDRFLDPAQAQPRSLRQVDRMSTLLSLVGSGRGLSIQPSMAANGSTADHGATLIDLSAELPVQWYILTSEQPSEIVSRAVERLGSMHGLLGTC